jgi:hypothetical protein
MRIIFIGAILLLTLSGCASSTHNTANVNHEQTIFAQNMLINCYKTKINELDDGLSDAATVSQAVIKACENETIYFVDITAAGKSAAYKHGFYLSMTEPNSLIGLVLKHRNEMKK